MKLYSRSQVVVIVCVTAIAMIAIFAGMLLTFNFTRSQSTEAVEDDISEIEETQEETTYSDTPVFEFKTSSLDLVKKADLEGYSQDEIQNITVYENCKDAVVNITTEVVAVNWFLEPVPQEGSSGSGAIIDKRGYVVTNSHVIADAYRIYISLADGTQYEGTVVGSDAASDIAVVKFTPPENMNLRTIDFGESSHLKVGQKVIAIGNPFGLERTMTTGIVSGLGRPIQSSQNTIIRNMIQTDTAINPGNSGGPLLDTRGRIIGINTMIYSNSGDSAGIGFAVPADTAKRVASELIQNGKVRRGTIDATFVQLNSSIANYAKLAVNSGLLVQQVAEKGNAAKAGLKGGTQAVRYGSVRNAQVIYLGGDVITAIDGIAVNSLAGYYAALESKKPGDEVSVAVLRGRKTVVIEITLTE